MIAMTLGEIATVVGGAVEPDHHAVLVSGDAFRDSRDVVAGGLYVALAGERVDGHEFAAAAVAAGAAAVLAEHPVSTPAVVVPDVVAALGVLARHVVARLPALTVVCLTGSQGKTTTKDMLAVVLADQAATVATVESLNNEIGLPLTALRATPDTRYLVAELGTRGHGQLTYLTDIVSPDVGLVLNVGVAHIGEFGDQDGIARAKGELVAALPFDGLAVLNADDPRVLAMTSRTSARIVTFGVGDDSDVTYSAVALDTDGHATMRLSWQGQTAELALRYVGEHHVANAAATAAAALGLGVGLESVVASLRVAEPASHWRMALSTSPDGVTVINDAYNANPDSTRAALVALTRIGERRGGARTIAVVGEMRELGDTSRDAHEAMGRRAAELGVRRLVVVGPVARPAVAGAAAVAGWSGSAEYVDDGESALALLRSMVAPGDVVLVKASRATGLEGVATALATGQPPTAMGGCG